MRGIVRLTLGVLAVTFAAPATAQAVIPVPPSTWFALPGLGAGAGAANVRSLAHSAAPNPTTLYAGVENGGVFRSTDGGANWSPFHAGFPSPSPTVLALVTSPDGTTALAGTSAGVWRTSGGGQWTALTLNHPVTALASPAGSPAVVFAGTDLGVYTSTDGGTSWTPSSIGSRIPAGEVIRGLSINGEAIYAASTAGVYASNDSGFTWARKSDGIPQAAVPVRTVAYPEHPEVLFTATTTGGVYRSINAGTTWAPMNDGLGSLAATGIQLVSSGTGVHLYVTTDNGLWETMHGGSSVSPAPTWRQVTQAGLGTHRSLGALTTPVFPTSGATGLIVGSTTAGGFVLGLEPASTTCSASSPMPGDLSCPVIDDPTPAAGNRLALTGGVWTGTLARDLTYQWQQCTGVNPLTDCTDITDATAPTYAVPKASIGLRFRGVVTVHNPDPGFVPVARGSVVTQTATSGANYPGALMTAAGSVEVLAPGTTNAPKVGDTANAKRGQVLNAMTQIVPGWFSPDGDAFEFQWLRCDSAGAACTRIADATQQSYTLSIADGAHTLRVIVHAQNGSGHQEIKTAPSQLITSAPAAVADPLPGGLSQAPSIGGQPFAGQVLTGFVGGWKDPTTDFRKTWLRCDAAGAGCVPIARAGGVEDGSSYVVSQADLGSTIRLRVLADVNGDLTPDGNDSAAPAAVTVESGPTAAALKAIVPAGGGAGSGGNAGDPSDVTAPVIAKLRLTKKSFVAGKSTSFRLTLSEAAVLSIVITRPVAGRKIGKRCKPVTKKNAAKKQCTVQRLVTTLSPADAAGGDVSLAFKGLHGKTGKKKLPVGSYMAVFTATDASGNASKPASVKFTIKRR